MIEGEGKDGESVDWRVKEREEERKRESCEWSEEDGREEREGREKGEEKRYKRQREALLKKGMCILV